MQIILNGENATLKSNITVLELIQEYNLSPQKVAIELNLTIINQENYSKIRLSSGDKVEIVEFVGGG